MAIANGTISYLPNQTIAKFEEDLAYLPSLLSRNKDLILMPQYEDLKHIELLHSLSLPVPGQILQKDFFDQHQNIISTINQYKLWGWAPNWIHRLKKAKTVHSTEFEQSSFYQWNNQHKNIFSRKTALSILEKILPIDTSIYIPSRLVPKVLYKISEIEVFLQKHQQIILKAPWSASGRGLIVLRKNSLNVSIEQNIKHILSRQDYIMAEPLLNKKIDLSMHFEIKNTSISYKGITFFETNSNGQYLSHYLNQYPPTQQTVLDFLEHNKEQLENDLRIAISKSDIPKYYEGFFGVDLMIIELDNKLYFHPCVEINLRNNMGTIALHLEQLIHPEAKGQFKIVLNPKSSFEKEYSKNISSRSLLDGKIIKGSLPLVSPKGKQFGAFIKLD